MNPDKFRNTNAYVAYDDTVRNIDIDAPLPKMPLSGVSTRSGDLARFTLGARRHDDGCVHPPDVTSKDP